MHNSQAETRSSFKKLNERIDEVKTNADKNNSDIEALSKKVCTSKKESGILTRRVQDLEALKKSP